ncbi:hypothetical protein GRI58_12315 [Porphyrobacter algicida]|uniref:Uncharacterized protein n=1 Tax=Qipengyuania algicida TaxID=1836209 RepID=A0A845AL45_9SPHN|nr:hypothetical protein [Qipengyuania algicida]MXP29601.1 hypothetical protein [Qipengyuania algicida]
MPRIDLHYLTSHLELALSCAPSSTIDALRDCDALKRRLAAIDLAEFLVERLGTNLPTVEHSQEMPLPLGVGTAAM